mgnify:CR=1 FL=1
MARRTFDGAIAKRILLGVAAGSAAVGIVAALLVFPGIGLVVKGLLSWYEDADYPDRSRMRKTFRDLRKARFIAMEDLPDGTTKVMLTERGKKKVLQYRFEDMAIMRPKAWDGRWRIIIFDIPKRYKREREVWREKLKALGFVQLQRSVWIFPFPCRDEIDFLCEYTRISPFVRHLEVHSFDGSDEYEKIFNLS